MSPSDPVCTSPPDPSGSRLPRTPDGRQPRVPPAAPVASRGRKGLTFAAAGLLMLALTGAPRPALAGTVTLAWDPVSSPALAGYRLFYGPSAGNYTGVFDVGNTTYVAISTLTEGATFHFAVTAYDWLGGSSGYSNDVAKTIPTTTPPGALPPAPPPIAGATEVIPVVEYYHAVFDHYFVTGIPDEITKLDAGTIAGWQRTGYEFNAYSPESTRGSPVCRFFSTSFGAKSSHFYTPLATECDAVKDNPSWQFEGEVFRARLPAEDGSCAEGMTQVFRLYNDGKGDAPNHRYTTKVGGRLMMLEQGWVSEGYGPLGVMMCAPQ